MYMKISLGMPSHYHTIDMDMSYTSWRKATQQENSRTGDNANIYWPLGDTSRYPLNYTGGVAQRRTEQANYRGRKLGAHKQERSLCSLKRLLVIVNLSAV
jgi:hypothetical protein